MSPFGGFMDFFSTMPAHELIGLLKTFVIAFFGLGVLTSIYSIVVYILHALGLYTIAQRRGIRNAWLAWLPVGNAWILGSIADQYQYVAKGQEKNRRKVMFGLFITMFVLYLAIIGGYAAFLIATIQSEFDLSTFAQNMGMLIPVIVVGVSYLALVVIAVIITVYQYICYYNLFASCNPKCAVVFIILSLLFTFLLPFFVFGVRKNDKGMPPRKTQPPVQAVPVYEPVQIQEPEQVPTEQPVQKAAEEPVAEPSDFVE